MSKKEISNSLRSLDGRKAPGYDGPTYFAYKATDRNALLRYWTSLFNWLLQHQVFLGSWKIGLQVFLPKPNKSDDSLPKSWRPITLFPIVFKIACRVISMQASRQVGRGRYLDLQISTHLRDMVDSESPTSPVNECPNICFTLTWDGVKEFYVWEITDPSDSAMQVATGQKRQKCAQALSRLADAAGTDIQFSVFAFEVMGAIPADFEKVLQSLSPSSETDWLVDEIHRALQYYNHAL